ncbi:ankyrin repeat domain-containing protein [Pseudoalteromonas sp. SS15]|uniref:ankyrin repeat domain-containing protein n=1 Tax=Pseudoalteromonas sp. SS15 TaxID=3139393 RepID=UPI003BAC6E90
MYRILMVLMLLVFCNVVSASIDNAWKNVHRSIDDGNLQLLKQTLTKHPDILNYSSKSGKSLMSFVIEEESLTLDEKRVFLEYMHQSGARFDHGFGEKKLTPLSNLFQYINHENQTPITEILLSISPQATNVTDVNGKKVLNHFIPNPDTLEALIKAGADMYHLDKNDRTPLMTQVKNGFDESVKRFIELKVNINTANSKGYVALHMATHVGAYDNEVKPYDRKTRITQTLIDAGANINARSKNGRTPLMEHLSGRPDFTVFDEEHSFSYQDSAIALINAGANINIVNEDGLTALHFAAANGHFKVVKQLHKLKADINLKSKDGVSPLEYAARNGYADIAIFLKEMGASTDISKNTKPFIQGLVDSDVNAFIKALKLEDEESVEQIYADLSKSYKAYWNKNQLKEITAYFSKEWPLMVASRLIFTILKNDDMALSVILDNIEPEFIIEEAEEFPLHYVVGRGRMDAIEIVLSHQFNINERDDELDTPLMVAAMNGELAVVKKLLNRGAKPNLKNPSNDKTAFDYALEEGHNKVARYLLSQIEKN